MGLLSLLMYISIIIALLLLMSFLGLFSLYLLLIIFILLFISMDTESKLKLVFIITIFSLLGKVNSVPLTYNMYNTLNITVCIAGILMYFITNTYFDYLQLKVKRGFRPLVHSNNIRFFLIGLIYAFSIICGVIGTNQLWFLTTGIYNGLWFIITSLIVIGSSSLWNVLQVIILKDDNHAWDFSYSVLRSLFETISFCAVAWNSYYTWNVGLSWELPYFNLLASTLGFLVHTIASFYTIGYELSGHPSFFYGLWYLLSFNSVAWSTNGIVALISPYMTRFNVLFPSTLLITITTALLNPDIYRYLLNFKVIKKILILHILHYYLLVLNFVVLGYMVYLPFFEELKTSSLYVIII